MNPDLLLAFVVASVAFALLPGPALLYAIAQTLGRGRRAGLMAALGVHLGGLIHVVAAALGLSAVFRYIPELYTALKLLGAGYLIWLGLRMLLTRVDDAAITPARAGRQALANSVLVEVINPKTAMFFIAFLPQFADPAASWPMAVQMLVLGQIVNMLCALADICAVLTAGWLQRVLARSTGATAWLRRAGGVMLMGLGARLAVTR